MYNLDEVAGALNAHGFIACVVKTCGEAREKALELAIGAKTVGAGGSATLLQTGILDALVKSGKTVYSAALGTEDAGHKSMGADVYMLSANAVVKTGELINIDGRANRMGAFIYGPQKCVVVCGRNKITDDVHKAVARIKTVACPKNAVRLKLDTPCAKTGKCADCDSPQRMCNVVVRMQRPPHGRDIYVILVDEDLGF